jgi:hypothetical protein
VYRWYNVTDSARPIVLVLAIVFIIALATNIEGCLGPVSTPTPTAILSPVPSNIVPTATACPTVPVTVTLDPDSAISVELPFTDANNVRTFVSEYPGAKNVTLARLQEFLKLDNTEDTMYVMPNYTCVDFAKRLHDGAESHGIKSAMVTVYFSDEPYGHCFNAFQTTDHGLVYIDDTGMTLEQLHAGATPYDGVNYLVDGKGLGWMPMEQTNDNFTYEYYINRLAQFDAYVAASNQLQADYEVWNDKVVDLNDRHDAGQISNGEYQIELTKLQQEGADITKRSIDLDKDPRHQWVIARPMGTACEIGVYW